MAGLQVSIKQPCWTRPALLAEDRSFQIVIASAPTFFPSATLSNQKERIPAWLHSVRRIGPSLTCCTCFAPGASPGELYDLELSYEANNTRMSHTVGVLPDDRECLTLVHCSDLHLLKPVPPDALVDMRPRMRAMVARINQLNPDLVVCTGDVITRYDARHLALPFGLIRWQIQQACEILMRIQVPFFLTVGNHDAAFAATQRDWYTAMGGGWKTSTDDLSFDWGEYHLALMDGFAHYDGQNILLDSSFTADQLHWLRSDLLAASSFQRRLVFTHYDYRKQLPQLLEDLDVDLLFYGHSKGLYPEVLEANGIWDGHLSDGEAYHLVHLSPDNVTSEKALWAELGECLPLKNTI